MHGIGALVPDAQARLQRLLEANRQAVEHLDLSTVLRQIVEAAVEMVGAQFGAIGVLGRGHALDEFIHVGMDAATVARIGTPPVGRGLLGALTSDPVAVRLGTMSEDPRSVGFPAHHPEMNSFLGVPLEVRDEIYGHLYLADPRHDAFGPDDQQLVEALAATAGVAIAHARLFDESKRREQWTAATSRITHELLTDDDVDSLQVIAETMLELASADLVAVVLTDSEHPPYDGLVFDRAAGLERDSVVGVRLPEGTLVSRCLESRRPQLVDDIGAEDHVHVLGRASLGPAMAVPLPAEVGAERGARGCLFVLRSRGSHSFTEFELDVAASLAGHAALALDYADAREVRARSVTLEDRVRIARDLHDHVIQRLFAAGLHIQSVASTLPPGPAATQLGEQVEEIDATIRQIRSTIFGLNVRPTRADGVRSQILEVIKAATVTLRGPPEVTFRGPLDLLVPEALGETLAAVAREALTNVGRHAHARRVEVFLTADAREVVLEVLDDGSGLVDGPERSGLANLRARADALGGSFEVSSRTGPGTRLRWTAPLPAPPQAPTKDSDDPDR